MTGAVLDEKKAARKRNSTGNSTASDDGTEAAGPALVKPVANTIRIFRYLNQVSRPATVTEIARALQMNTSTCFSILRTLVAERVMAFDDRTKGYSLGLGIVELAQSALSEDGKIEIIRPHLQRIADVFDISLTLWSLALRDRMLLTCVVQSSADLQIQIRVGQRLPLLHGAVGRLVAQCGKFTKDEVRERFRQLRWDNEPGFENYWKQSLEAVERGWSVDDSNFARGVISIATPVLTRTGEMSHGLVATMFKGRHDESENAQIAEAMQKVCREIGPVF
jgi:DNA-binding IclR family transcriptional regulator